MKLTSLQLAGLKALADVDTTAAPERMLPDVRAAFTMGQVVGQAKLARELLQEARDRGEQLQD